ncbi:MAG: helix-hairpin-helix domain-containing protein [Firmicutes bacterium]|nr:helix-hairpin-helix domain-containing protein [Bacillota bacterium]
MKEFFEELRTADSVKDVLLEHKKETLQLAVALVVLMMAVLLYLHQGSTEIEFSDAARADGTRTVQGGADGTGAAGTGAGIGGSAGAEGSGAGGNGGVEAGTVQPLDTDGIVYVDIGGAVKQPMLAELPTGSRVEDAIQAAGGLTKKADLSQINRAQVLTDGEKVYIPEKGENGDLSSGAGGGGSSGSSGSGANGSSGGGETGTPGAVGMSGGKININTADVILLQQLTGVGPVTAQKIVDYREQNGNFSSIEELKNVSGIGEKTFEKMRDDVTI